ncbi:MAG: LPS export ABC transporter periplasmic protein LptC [Flavobacteriales bacterium]|nr:LPS export ABC transporter periplasmic protein LptC [Flavobacteriales bacterium]
MRWILFMMIVSCFSCKNDPLLVNEFFGEDEIPVEIIEKSNLIHTENGCVELEINANRIQRFIGDNPRLIFSDGFEVIFYNDSAKVISNLSALNAVVDEINNLMSATNFVVLKNSNRKLETEHLIWDQEKKLIYTDNDVIITTDKEVIYAEGFSSDPNFKDYTLKKISGRMYVNSINN